MSSPKTAKATDSWSQINVFKWKKSLQSKFICLRKLNVCVIDQENVIKTLKRTWTPVSQRWTCDNKDVAAAWISNGTWSGSELISHWPGFEQNLGDYWRRREMDAWRWIKWQPVLTYCKITDNFTCIFSFLEFVVMWMRVLRLSAWWYRQEQFFVRTKMLKIMLELYEMFHQLFNRV